MLNRDALREEQKRGSIYVDNGVDQLDTNFINLTMGDTIKVYDTPSLDVTKPSPTIEIPIPEDGLILKPNELYIGRTFEFTKTYGFVPILTGTEELAALGMEIHITAGFGDNGFEGTWTLEIVCANPTRVYPNMSIGQMYYNPLIGAGNNIYRGKYFRQVAPTASRLSNEYDEHQKPVSFVAENDQSVSSTNKSFIYDTVKTDVPLILNSPICYGSLLQDENNLCYKQVFDQDTLVNNVQKVSSWDRNFDLLSENRGRTRCRNVNE